MHTCAGTIAKLRQMDPDVVVVAKRLRLLLNDMQQVCETLDAMWGCCVQR